MKTITNVEYQKNNQNRVNIYINNKYAFGLDYEIYLKYNLQKDMQLEDDFIEEVLLADDEAKALNYALTLLSRSSKTEKEIKDKLNEKGYENKITDRIIAKLKEYNYINDEYYCDKYINDKINFTKKGINKIKAGLYQKGVNKDIISQKISNVDMNLEYERALSVAEKKINTLNETDKFKLRSKLFSFLANKGYSFDIANKAVSEVLRIHSEQKD